MIKPAVLAVMILSGMAVLTCSVHAATATTTPKVLPPKVLHIVLNAAESSLDPAVFSDHYSAEVAGGIFEPLYTYDYLARPVRLVPLTATALPEVSEDGKSYTIHLKHGIYFHDNPAFKGKLRELTVNDYVFAWKRLFDPAIRSPNKWLLEGQIAGLDDLEKTVFAEDSSPATQKSAARTFYETPVSGLEVIDRHTLRIHLRQPDHNFALLLAHRPTSAIAHEIVNEYGNQSRQVSLHPVGTGPFMLKSWRPGSQIVLQAFPNFRKMIWDSHPGNDPASQKIAHDMAGKTIPQLDQVIFEVIPEDQTGWLAFRSGKMDMLELLNANVLNGMDGNRLKPELAREGIQISSSPQIMSSYTEFNMRDPVLGGSSHAHIALRRAIIASYDIQREVALKLNYQGRAARFPVPEGALGYDPDYVSPNSFNRDQANGLLDLNGYKVGSDGWRRQPDGSPLTLQFLRDANPTGLLDAQLWKAALDGIKIKMIEDVQPFAEKIKSAYSCRYQFTNASWVADYPDGDNFMQLFYGKNIHKSNSNCVDLPAYNQRYEESVALPDSPRRRELYREMTRILDYQGSTFFRTTRDENILMQQRVTGYKWHPIVPAWMSVDIRQPDATAKQEDPKP